MRIVLVTEKPYDVSCVLPRVLDAYPQAGQDVAVVTLLSAVLLPTRFTYPTTLRWADYPVTPEPAYRPISFDDPAMRAHAAWRGWRRHVPVDDHDSGCRPGPARLDRTGLLAFAAGCDLVIDAMGHDPAGRHAFQRFLHDYPVRSGTRVVDIGLRSLAGTDIARGLKAARFWDADDPAVPRDRLKRRFDYGYAVNAQAILRRTLTAAGIDHPVAVPSKFQVQALYALRGLGPSTEGRLIDAMARWAGTGRYERRPDGTATSGSAARRRVHPSCDISWDPAWPPATVTAVCQSATPATASSTPCTPTARTRTCRSASTSGAACRRPRAHPASTGI